MKEISRKSKHIFYQIRFKFQKSPFLDECQVNDDCPFNKECKQNECQDPCLSIICGRRAECKAESHRAICFCPPGLQGNPLISCSEVGCVSNSDCSDREKCDYLTRSSAKKECVQLCRNNPCASGASCSAINHRESCSCNHRLQGDGYVSCTERKPIMYCFHFTIRIIIQ